MTLTNWLVDYVFTPLRMATRALGDFGLACSITINMVALSLWHGMTGGFIVFGLLHSGYITAEALTSRWRSRFFKKHQNLNATGDFLGRLLTFHFVAFALVFFRSPHLSGAFWLLRHLATGWANVTAVLESMMTEVSARNLAIGLIGYAVLELCERFRPDLRVRNLRATGPRWLRWSFYFAAAIALAFGLSLFVLHTGQARSPFIYEIF